MGLKGGGGGGGGGGEGGGGNTHGQSDKKLKVKKI
jgi:hypothetical protein